MVGLQSLKLSSFEALFHGSNLSYIKIQEIQQEFLLETLRISRKIEFIIDKPGGSLLGKARSLKKNWKVIRFLQIFLKMNSKTHKSFDLEWLRYFFHKWRLICFESGLRKLFTYQTELIQKQILDQMSNVYLTIAKPTIKEAFDKIFYFGRTQSSSPVNMKVQRQKSDKLFGFQIFFHFIREKIAGDLFDGFFNLKNFNLKKKEPKMKITKLQVLAIYTISNLTKSKIKNSFLNSFYQIKKMSKESREIIKKKCANLASEEFLELKLIIILLNKKKQLQKREAFLMISNLKGKSQIEVEDILDEKQFSIFLFTKGKKE